MIDKINVTWLIHILPYLSLLIIIYGHKILGNYVCTLS
jgi:hypothetical protein